MATSGSLYPKATRLYPKGYIYPDLVFFSSAVKARAVIAKPRLPPYFNLCSINTQTSFSAPEFSQNLIYHVSGSLYPKASKLYPKGFTYKGNVFTAKSLLSKQLLANTAFDITFNFLSADIKAKTKILKPDFKITYIFYSQTQHAQTKTTSPAIYTNPAAFYVYNVDAQTKSNFNIDKLPDWYKPHKDNFGIGVYYKDNKPQNLSIELDNIQAKRLEKCESCFVQKAERQDIKNSVKWLEKRTIDYFDTLLEDDFDNKTDRQNFFNVPTPNAFDSYKNIDIGDVFNIDDSILLPAVSPGAKDILNSNLWANTFRDDKDLLFGVPQCDTRDRNETVPWGGEFLQICKRRYKPPIELDFELNEKITARIEDVPKQKLYGTLYPKSTKLRPALGRTNFNKYLFVEHREATL